MATPPGRPIADGGFEEPEAVANATYCDAGGQVSCTHVLLRRAGELVVRHQSNITGRSFQTHYADTFNANGTAPLHSCSSGEQDGAKIGVSVSPQRLTEKEKKKRKKKEGPTVPLLQP